MKLCRFQPQRFRPEEMARAGAQPEIHSGVVAGELVAEVSGDMFGVWGRTGRQWPLAEVRLVPPVSPSKVVCVGRNYREHAAELKNPVPTEPLIFLKPPSSIIGPDEPILLPPISKRVDHEGELGVVIGLRCARLGPGDDVRPYVLGYTCVNDVTARDIQIADVQFTRGKSFDTFCPLGPVIETDLDTAAATVETFVNGKCRQAGRVQDMIFPLDVIIRWIAQVMTLEPGDVIATGTPSGVGPLTDGDIVEVVVSGVGTLRNPVAAQE